MRKLLVIFLLISQLTTTAQTVIKMKRDGGVSVIPCKVNGLPLDFIFDTGASDVSISMVEATFMLKNGYLTANDIGEKSNFLDAAGNINVGISLTLKEIEIAGLKLYNVKASVVQTINAPLLLGQSAISKLGIIQLNLETNTLTILNGKDAYGFSNNSQQSQATYIESKSTIIGNPIRIDNLEVTQYESPNPMDWEAAKNACASLGNGWRLPTKDELNTLFKNMYKIGGFAGNFYWSSTGGDSNYSWGQNFTNGNQEIDFIKTTYYVRAVRAY